MARSTAISALVRRNVREGTTPSTAISFFVGERFGALARSVRPPALETLIYRIACNLRFFSFCLID